MKGFNCDEAIVTSEELCSHIDEVIDKKIAVLETAITARLEKTVENGVSAALAKMGLQDRDMFELSNLLSNYRMIRHEAGRALVGWFIKGVTFIIIIGLLIKYGALTWPK